MACDLLDSFIIPDPMIKVSNNILNSVTDMADMVAITSSFPRGNPLIRDISLGKQPDGVQKVQADENVLFKKLLKDSIEIEENASTNTWKNPHFGESGKLLDQIMEMQSANRLAQKLQQIATKPVVTANFASRSYAIGRGLDS